LKIARRKPGLDPDDADVDDEQFTRSVAALSRHLASKFGGEWSRTDASFKLNVTPPLFEAAPAVRARVEQPFRPKIRPGSGADKPLPTLPKVDLPSPTSRIPSLKAILSLVLLSTVAVAFLYAFRETEPPEPSTGATGLFAPPPLPRPLLPSSETNVATSPAAASPPVAALPPAALQPLPKAVEEVLQSLATPPSTPASSLTNSASATLVPDERALDTYQILEAQARLRDLNLNPGPLDGVIGSQTVAAVKRYEQMKGLPRTGKLDGDLLTRLRADPELRKK
jgi:hypothetical protein